MIRFIAAFVLVAALSGTAYADDIYQAVTTHVGDVSETVTTLPAFDEDGRNKFQNGIEGVQVFMTASGFVAITPTPFATAASAPIPIPANTIVRMRANGSEVISIRLEAGSGKVYVTEITK